MPIIDRAADGAAAFLSSKTAVVVFTLLPLFSASQAVASLFRGDVEGFVGWLSQSFIQLVALPLLGLNQRREAERQRVRAIAAEQHAEEMYTWFSELHTALHTAHGKLDGLHAKFDGLGDEAES